MRGNLEKNLAKDLATLNVLVVQIPTKQLNYYTVPTLTDETLQTVVIHIGSNDITKMNYKTINVQDLAQGIIDIGLKCKSYGVSRIVISSIHTRVSAQLNQVIGKVNDLLKSLFVTNGFHCISNEMIDHRMLWKDGIHLTDDGTKILDANVLNYLNINLENAINFNVDFHNSENDMLDWQQTSKAKSLSFDIYWRGRFSVFKKSRQ